MQSKSTSMLLRRPSTSVAICTFNGAQYLEQQLSSILNQDLVPDEIVICDDASSDDTIRLLESFVRNQKCLIRLFLGNANIGYTRNFEKAIELCTGDIIFFSDQDDVWYSDKISIVCRLFEQNPDIAGVTHDGRLVDQDLNWHGTTKEGQIIRGYGSNHNEITGALSAIRRSYLGIFFPIPIGVVGHDKWLTYIFSFFRKRWLYSGLCLQDIRRHSGNTSEWIVNSFKPVSSLSVLRSELSTHAALDYADRRLVNEALLARLCGLVGKTELFTTDEILAALCCLRDELDSINARESILAIGSKSRRMLASLSLWKNGGYKHFNGLKSLARDLLR